MKQLHIYHNCTTVTSLREQICPIGLYSSCIPKWKLIIPRETRITPKLHTSQSTLLSLLDFNFLNELMFFCGLPKLVGLAKNTIRQDYVISSETA